MSQHLSDMDIDRVSLVDKGANGRVFAILKRAGDGGKETAMLDPVAKGDPEATPAGQASILRKIADFLTGGRVSKAQTFGSMIAGEELSDALDDSYDTLWSALWSAMYACDDMGQDISMPDKQALVAQSLDEFKAYLLNAMQVGVGKRARPSEVAVAKRRITTLIAKVGAKVSAARLERLQAAAEALNSVLAEVESDTEKRADAQEVDMTPDELTTAIAKAQEPLLARLEAIEKRVPAEKVVEKAADELTLEGVAAAVLEIRDQLDPIVKARGERTSADGQDGDSKVAKRSVFAGVL